MNLSWRQCVVWLAALTIASGWLTGRAQLGEPAPELKIAAWIKGGPVQLPTGKGTNVLVIELWATSSASSRDCVPRMAELQNSFRNRGVVFVGISVEPEATIKGFVGKLGKLITFAVAADDNRQTTQALGKAFGSILIPHAFVVDTNGLVVWHGHPKGALEWVLDRLLAGQFDVQAARNVAQAQRLAKEYLRLATTGAADLKAAALADKVIKDGDPVTLNEFTWALLAESRLPQPSLDLAARAAKAACDASSGRDPAALDTYARALFRLGRLAEAIQTQRRAVAAEADPRVKAELQRTLEQYQAPAAQK